MSRADELMDEIWDKNEERREIFELAFRGQQMKALEHLERASLPIAHTVYVLSLTGQSKRMMDHLEHATIFKFRVYLDPIFAPARTDPWFENVIEETLKQDIDVL